VSLFKPGCPIDADEREWIDRDMAWFTEEFGAAVARRTVILPTPEFFPGRYTGTAAEVPAVVRRVCGYLRVDPDRIQVEVEPDDDEAARLRAALPAYRSRSTGAAGHYQVRDGRAVVTVSGATAGAPMALVATIAHELCHELLLGGGRIERDRPDGEPLTDLLSVYVGTGIFAANAAFEFSKLGGAGWQASRLGYLTEPMYGYALARYALLRGEPDPPWSRYLDTNPRTFLKRSLRYLKSVSPGRPGTA
jgi:hypothetical protein